MKTAFCILLSLTALHLHAQDVIVKKDGSTILAKVLEIGTSEVKYKKFSNQNGPTYNISTTDLQAINYENGEKEDFNNVSATPTTSSTSNGASQRYVQKPADSRNAELLEFYNRIYQPTANVKKKPKASKDALVVFGIKKSSIMSNEEIEIMFEQDLFTNVYNIIITNKTDGTVYIDKGNCFRQQGDNEAFCYYENTEQTTVNIGGGSGASLGLGSVAGVLGVGGKIGQLAGGIGVGGGSSHSVSTTYQQQRVIAIPPHGKKRLSEEKHVQTNKLFVPKFKQIGWAEHFTWGEYDEILPYILKKGVVNQGEVKTYEESELPWKRTYYLTYSTEEDFRTYSTLHFELFIHEIIGTKKAWDISAWDSYRDKFMDGLTDNSLFVGGKLN